MEATSMMEEPSGSVECFTRKRGAVASVASLEPSLHCVREQDTFSSLLSTGSTQEWLKTINWDVNNQMNDCFSLANSADHDEMGLYATFDFGVHCLQK